MKTTLKDIPDSPQKRAFEKELRQLVAEYADKRHTSPNNSAYLLLGMEAMIRHILGESK